MDKWGFFVINPKFLDYIKNDNTYLEKEPLEKICKLKNLIAYKHKGFWQCVDTTSIIVRTADFAGDWITSYRWYRFYRLSMLINAKN